MFAHGIDQAEFQWFPLAPFMAVLIVLAIVLGFLLVVQTLRLRDRPTRWEQDKIKGGIIDTHWKQDPE